jgi:hypothetical protein
MNPQACIFLFQQCIACGLLEEETGVPGENHRPAASHWQTSSYNVVLSTPRLIGILVTMLVVIGTDCIGSDISNYRFLVRKITEILLKMAINNINHLNETKSNRVMDLISKVMKWLYLYIKVNHLIKYLK